MFNVAQNNQTLALINKNWGWFLAWGIFLIILGLAAVSASTFTTLVSVVFLGFLILVSGILVLIDSFTSWWGRWGNFVFHILMGLLYLIVGGMLIKSPLWGAVSLTLLLAILFILLGAFRIVFSLSASFPHWGWSLFNGIITLVLGIFIFLHWPAASLFFIGLFVGIDLIFFGWTYIMLALSVKKM